MIALSPRSPRCSWTESGQPHKSQGLHDDAGLSQVTVYSTDAGDRSAAAVALSATRAMASSFSLISGSISLSGT